MTAIVWPDEYQALRAKLSIDLLDLDHELSAMPGLVQDAAELAAEANDAENAAHLAYDIVRAQTAMNLREGTERISEARIDSQLPLEADVQEARNAYDQAKTYAELCKALVNAFRTKSSALQKASDLIISGYLTPNAAYQRRRDEIRQQRTGNNSRPVLNRR